MSIRTVTQEDPIGLAGGLNLYGFAGGDPINFSDPFGLCPDCDDEDDDQEKKGGINAVKAAVGTVNIVKGVATTASGASVLVGTAPAKALGIPLPADALGVGRIGIGLAGISRGAGQLSESINDESGAAWENLAGVLPWGQHYDDRVEPTFGEYWKGKFDSFVASPLGTVKDLVVELFSPGRGR